MLWVKLAVLLTLTTNAVGATELGDFAGTWVLRLGQRNMFVLTLAVEGDQIVGHFDRPVKFTSSGDSFGDIRGGVEHETIVLSRLEDGILHFKVQSATNPKDQDAYTLTLKADHSHAEFAFDNLPAGVVLQPRSLERASATATVATDWEPNRLYSLTDSDVPNAEMKAIFDEDQRVRASSEIDWNVVSKTDAERRQRTRKLLADGALHTGKDYEEAAFVFQHGEAPDDYLLAHTLAMVAVSQGDPSAIWIATASLDRYLQKIGQKQVFGTQYLSDANNHWTQEPYNRDLVSDALRKQLGVPSQEIQAKQLKAYASEK